MAKTNGKFNLTDLLNQRSKTVTEENVTTAEKAVEARPEEGTPGTADIYDLVPSKDNFYNVEDVADLKQSIELLGVLQPFLVTEPQEDRKRHIVAGHRRQLAVLQLVEEGKEQFRYVPILEKQKKNAILDRLALIMANRFREKTDWEKMTEVIETEMLVMELKGSIDIPGRTRDLLAEIIETSPAQVGRYKAIKNNLCEVLMAEFKANNIGISVIYEASGLPTDYQQQAAELFRENGVLSLSDIKQLKKEEEAAQQIPGQIDIKQLVDQQDEEETDREVNQQVENQTEGTQNTTGIQEDFEPRPEYVQSLCYTCVHYEDCHVKTATVRECETYLNRKEAFKTEEQRYNEEQATIDRETQRKLREQADEAKMQQLPSDEEPKQYDIRLTGEKYEEITSGKLSFLLLKKDGYKVGEELELPEFKAGTATGRKVDIKIIYIWKDWSGLDEDYCIIGFNVTAFDA